jgi:hypothetical protein
MERVKRLVAARVPNLTNDARWCAPSRSARNGGRATRSRARLVSPAHTRWDSACHPAAYVTRLHALGQRVPPAARLAYAHRPRREPNPRTTRGGARRPGAPGTADERRGRAPGLRHPSTRAGTARATRRLTSPAHTRWDSACHPAAYVTRLHALGQRVPPAARLASPVHTRWDSACHPAAYVTRPHALGQHVPPGGLRHPPTRAGTARATRRSACATRPHALGQRVPPGARLTYNRQPGAA